VNAKEADMKFTYLVEIEVAATKGRAAAAHAEELQDRIRDDLDAAPVGPFEVGKAHYAVTDWSVTPTTGSMVTA